MRDFVLVAIVLYVKTLAIQIHWSPSRETQEGAEKTLRQFLSAEDYHAGLAPIRCSTIIHLSILHVLRAQNLSQGIKSLSGSSTGGLAAAIWATLNHENQSVDYASIFGRNLLKEDCEPHCTHEQQHYLHLLDSPINSETRALLSLTKAEGEIYSHVENFNKGFQRTPSVQNSHLNWVQTLWFIDYMKIPINFSETRLALAVTGLDNSRADSHTIVMSKGNLHVALLGTTSPPGNTEPVWINEKFKVTDGYFGDEHGARGYDGIDPELRPPSLLNIVLLDVLGQDTPMNFSHLAAHTQLRQAASVMMAIGQPMSYHWAEVMHVEGFKALTYRDLVAATQKSWMEILDKPLSEKQSLPKGGPSYAISIDLKSSLPSLKGIAHSALRRLDEDFSQQRMLINARMQGIYEAEQSTLVLGVEVTDHGHLLDGDLQMSYSIFKNASAALIRGDEFGAQSAVSSRDHMSWMLANKLKSN